jgi:hypothetical protein
VLLLLLYLLDNTLILLNTHPQCNRPVLFLCLFNFLYIQVVSYVAKQLGPAVVELNSVEEVLAFVDDGDGGDGDDKHQKRPEGSSAVVGFFNDPLRMEEDEYAEFLDAVAPFQVTSEWFVLLWQYWLWWWWWRQDFSLWLKT